MELSNLSYAYQPQLRPRMKQEIIKVSHAFSDE
jgi:hypothetical protein